MNSKEKQELRNVISKKAVNWLLSGDTGISSESMLVTALGIKSKRVGMHGLNAPYDPSDFKRCLELVKEIPEIKEFFPEISKKIPVFKKILENWNELEDIYEKDKKYGISPELYYLIGSYRGDRNFASDVLLGMSVLGKKEAIDKLKESGFEKLKASMGQYYKFLVTSSFEQFSRGMIKSVREGNNIRSNVLLKVNDDFQVHLDPDRILNSNYKSEITKDTAQEIFKFIDNDLYIKDDFQSIQKLAIYFKNKFPDLVIKEGIIPEEEIVKKARRKVA